MAVEAAKTMIEAIECDSMSMQSASNKELAGERVNVTDKHTNNFRTRIVWDSSMALQNSK